MKKVFHKISAVLMALVVLCTTMSFTIDEHYCGDTLMNTSIFQKAKGCGMEMVQTSSEDCAVVKTNCCKDQHIFIEGQNELQLTLQNISFEQQLFIVSFIDAYRNAFQPIKENQLSYLQYPPPLIVRQIFKLDETYLI